MEEEKEIDTDWTDEITCPYCGFEHGDSWEIDENSGSFTCDKCKKEFNYERNTTITYTTTKI